MTSDSPVRFDHLDDVSPPPLDDDGWQHIRRRSRELARRRRIALTTASAAGVIALILVAAGLALVGRNRGDGVATVGGSSATEAATASTAPSSSVWVTVALEVDRTVVSQGQDVTGTVVFDNHRTERVVLPDAPAAEWQVVVGSGTVEPVVEWLDSSIRGQRLDLRPGITRVAFRAATTQPLAPCPNNALACTASYPAGPARVWFVADGAVAHVAIPSPVTIRITGRGGSAPLPLPCPVPSPEPSMATGGYCGPAPHRGSGLGTDGVCTGRETAAPCGPGVVPGRYYAYTLPGSCDARIVFDGRRWNSELPPPHAIADLYVWMRLDPSGELRFIGPQGSVGFRPDTGQPVSNCQRPAG